MNEYIDYQTDTDLVIRWGRSHGVRTHALLMWRRPSTGDLISLGLPPISPQQADNLSEVLGIADDDLYRRELQDTDLEDDEQLPQQSYEPAIKPYEQEK